MPEIKELTGIETEEQPRGYDKEGKYSDVKEYIRARSGTVMKADDISGFTKINPQQVSGILVQLQHEGRVTKHKHTTPGQKGIKFRYVYHETVVPKDQRTVIKRDKVTVTYDKDIVKHKEEEARKAAEKVQRSVEYARKIDADIMEFQRWHLPKVGEGFNHEAIGWMSRAMIEFSRFTREKYVSKKAGEQADEAN